MCGIIGICKKTKLSDSDIQKVEYLSSRLSHRGPDQNNSWVDKSGRVYLSHRRLSINDLSMKGNQPMVSADQRYIIVYNGEIYNFLQLKDKLKKIGIRFDGNSDTEVVLRLINLKGVYEAIQILNGMFSLAIFDSHQNKIFLTRDFTGQKPLYFFHNEEYFFFTSELRNIKSFFPKVKINKNALKFYFQLSYIPQSYSIYQDFYKLEKGSILEFDILTFLKKKIENKSNNLFYKKFNNALNENKINQFEDIFLQVMQDHMVSDVSTGSLLSGGIDSSLVTLYAKMVSKKRINTYCVKSNFNFYDESKYAENIAKIIGTDHNTLEFKKSQFLECAMSIHKVYDEPFGDSSQLPTFLLFNNIKDKIKVAITGDGGDEIFGGYNRYLYLENYYNLFLKFNYKLRKKVSEYSNNIPYNIIEKLNNLTNSKYSYFGDKFRKAILSLNFKNLKEFYFQIVRQDYSIENIVLNNDCDKLFIDLISLEGELSNLKKFQKIDFDNYLTDDIFVKVDRASMFNSVESRAPFLDKRVISFAKSLKDDELIKGNKSKYFLRVLMNKHFTEKKYERPKMGFGNPMHEIINSDLKEWINQIILEDNDEINELINIKLIRSLWKLHNSKKMDYSNIIWNFVVFRNWYVFNN